MDIQGKIINVLPERGGVSQRTGSEWKVASYVLETFEQYPRKMVFEVFGTDKIAQFNIQVGQSLTVSFDIDAREYNGRWYNTVRAWRVAPFDPNAQAAPAAPMGMGAVPGVNPPFPPAQPAAAPQQPADMGGSFAAGGSNDDLPF